MPTKPTRSIVGCCARTAGGHAAAAPPGSVLKSRRRIWIAMGPSRGRSCPCNGGTISRFERAVCDYFTLGSAAGADCKGKQGGSGHRCPVGVVRLEASRVQSATEWLTTCVVRQLANCDLSKKLF